MPFYLLYVVFFLDPVIFIFFLSSDVALSQFTGCSLPVTLV